MRWTRAALTVVAFFTLACAGNPLEGEWEGVCEVSGNAVAFALRNLDTDNVGSVSPSQDPDAAVSDPEGELEAYRVSGDWAPAGELRSLSGDLIRCLSPEGCAIPPDTPEFPGDGFRYQLRSEGAGDIALFLEGVYSEKKALDGRCYVIDLGWGTFTAEKVQAGHLDASDED